MSWNEGMESCELEGEGIGAVRKIKVGGIGRHQPAEMAVAVTLHQVPVDRDVAVGVLGPSGSLMELVTIPVAHVMEDRLFPRLGSRAM